MGCPKFTFSSLKFSSVIAFSMCAFTACAEGPVASDTPAMSEADKATFGELPGENKTPEAAAPAAASIDAKPAESSAAPTVSTSKSRQRPDVLKTPIETEGFWLNAFYFPREANENWETVSQKLYGRPDRSGLLKKWNNGARVRVGEPIYYNSPSRPDDSEHIKVFAEDFGYKLEEITIKKGDSLSKIGEMKLGNLKSWKEIAALNPEIANPDVIEVGQVIRVQPKEVDTRPVLQSIIKEVTQAQDIQAAQVAQNNQEQANDAAKASTLQLTADQVAQNDQNKMPPAPPAAALAPATDEQASATKAQEQTQTPPAAAPPAAASNELSMNATKSSSFKASNLLGFAGAGLLLISAGMILYRRILKFRAAKTRVQP